MKEPTTEERLAGCRSRRSSLIHRLEKQGKRGFGYPCMWRRHILSDIRFLNRDISFYTGGGI